MAVFSEDDVAAGIIISDKATLRHPIMQTATALKEKCSMT
jgi:hypothetical protein